MRVRILGQYVPSSLATLALIEASLSFLALYAAVFIRFEVGVRTLPLLEREQLGPLWPRGVAFSAIVMACLLAVGLYSSRQRVQLSGILARLMVALLVSSCAMVALFYVVPSLRLGRGVAALAVTLVLCGVVASRLIFARVADEEIFKRRVLVYGAGTAATAIARLRRAADRHGFTLAGFVQPPSEPCAVPTERVLDAEGDLCSSLRPPRRHGGRGGHGRPAPRLSDPGAARLPSGGCRRHRAPHFPRARNRARAHRLAESELADIRTGVSARPVAAVFLPRARCTGEPGRPRGGTAGHAAHLPCHQTRGRLAGAGAVQSGASGPRRQGVQSC